MSDTKVRKAINVSLQSKKYTDTINEIVQEWESQNLNISSETCDDQLAVLPKYILNDFENTDWTITLTSNDIATTYSFDGDKKNSVKGITEYDFHKIYIQLDKESIYDTPLHEMGHWIDNYYGNLSKKDDFQEIYKKDGWHFKYDFYNISEFSQEEMFAEAIYIFYNEPNHLKEKCPNTYKYVKNFLD